MKTQLIIMLIIFSVAINLQAQKKFIKGCNQSETVRIASGETFTNNCDSAYVLNSIAARILYGKIENIKEMMDSLNSQKIVLKSIIDKYDSINDRYENISRIQDSSYAKIKYLQTETSILVNASVDNTNRALSYARKIKFGSYLTSFAVGGIAGGLIDNKVYTFGLGGALVGAACGVVINILIQELITGD